MMGETSETYSKWTQRMDAMSLRTWTNGTCKIDDDLIRADRIQYFLLYFLSYFLMIRRMRTFTSCYCFVVCMIFVDSRGAPPTSNAKKNKTANMYIYRKWSGTEKCELSYEALGKQDELQKWEQTSEAHRGHQTKKEGKNSGKKEETFTHSSFVDVKRKTYGYAHRSAWLLDMMSRVMAIESHIQNEINSIIWFSPFGILARTEVHIDCRYLSTYGIF